MTFALLCLSGLDSFFSEVLRIGAPDYLPNEHDVLRARAKSTGIAETRYALAPSLPPSEPTTQPSTIT